MHERSLNRPPHIVLGHVLALTMAAGMAAVPFLPLSVSRAAGPPSPGPVRRVAGAHSRQPRRRSQGRRAAFRNGAGEGRPAAARARRHDSPRLRHGVEGIRRRDDDACRTSPGRVTEALVVDDADSRDRRRSDSDHGTCTDLFAPGTIRDAGRGTPNRLLFTS